MHDKQLIDPDKTESVSSFPMTIQDLFETQANLYPLSEAIIYNGGPNLSDKQILTYGELNTRANQLAHFLISLGVKPDMLVGICMERSADLIVGILGILKAGGAYLPVDLSYPRDRLLFMLGDSETALILTQKDLVDKIPETKAAVILIDDLDLAKESKSNPEVEMNDSNLAYVIYTSGSTGKPNGVMVTHHNVRRLFHSTSQWFNFNEKDVWTFFHSYAFDFSVWEIWGALLHGGKLIIVPYLLSRSPESFYNLIVNEKVTVLNQTPSAFYQLMQAEEVSHNKDELSLRYVIFGGEALNMAALKPWFDRHSDTNPQLINMYGITETTVHVTYRPITSKDLNAGSVIGTPIPDLRVYILNEKFEAVKIGESGEIYVGGAGLSRGYINRPGLNGERFIKNPFSDGDYARLYKTGDLGRLLEGNDIEYLGRIDHQVKIRGFRIEPGEIESSIRNYKGVKDCAVKVHHYSEDVIVIIAYLVSDDILSLDELKEFLRQFLPDYMLPNSYVNLDKIPLTPNGKTDFKALPIPELNAGTNTSVNGHKEFTEIENAVREIWINLLGYENIGMNDNFFDVGGNSLLMGRLQLKANQTFNETISLVDLFRYPTITSLANFISSKSESPVNSETVRPDRKNPVETDIAIIGMAGKYPGADSINEFWQNLINGVESITFFSEEELEYIPKGNLNSEIKFIRARGYLKDADKFDAGFFGFNPREASVMDPQHRLFLECAWAALEDAGYCSEKYKGSIGVFAGSSLNTYLIYNVLKDRESAEEMANSYQIADYTTLTGNDNAFLTTKIAYKLGLRGPAVNLQTACSTSLVAVEQAYQSLVSGQSDMALAGGVSITFPQKRGYFFVDGSIGSEDGHCKPFDADATGTVFSHGAGIVVLKRLKDAIKDGDSIYAVIKSIAVNNDGSDKAGYMTPSVEGQSEVILKAQKSGGIDPSTIRYIETHGTGTPVGDPIEVASLEKAFGKTKEKQFCGIGSVKSNVGHTDAAAGVTGLIKTALSLYNRVIPPTLHYKNPNPRIDFANSPFYVVDKLTDLSTSQRPLRAAVSAFGVGGTNAHAILEEFPYVSFSCEEDRDKYLLIVSARTENSLNNNLNALKDYLQNNPEEAINDVAYTLQVGRKEFEHRRYLIADSCKNAAGILEDAIKSGSNKKQINFNDRPQLVFMFPGQGAQYVNMGKGLYTREKIFRETVDHCAEYLKPILELDIRELLFPKINIEETAKKLEQTVYTQPALFIVEYALARVLLSIGIKPASMIGHSIGDYTAACLAGVFSLDDALYIIAMRARIMQEQEHGSMLSVRLNESEIKPWLDEDISLAAINSPNLVVLSGPTEKIKGLSGTLSEMNIENRMLFTSHAYHSKMMEPALAPFAAEFSKIKLNKPSSPFISSLSGTWITDEQATSPDFWTMQLRNTVRFSDGIIELQKKNHLVLIELGPGRALSTMASQHRNSGIRQTTVTTLMQPNEKSDDKSNLLDSIGKLWLEGIKIDWDSLYKEKKRRRLHLPSYQFDRKSYWIEAPQTNKVQPRVTQAEIPQGIKKAVKRPKIKRVVQQSDMTRKEYITDILKSVLEELSGIKKADLDESKSFFELGFDSLFMTQVSLAFQKKFDVKITLRQLLDTAPTISAIADFVDGKLPEGKFDPPAREIEIEEEGEEIVEEYEDSFSEVKLTATPSNPGSSAVENLIREQLEIMRKQLEVLGVNGTIHPSAKSDIIINQEIIQRALPTVEEKKLQPENKQEKKVFERFGPYNPIKTNKDGSLTEKQQKYLDKLIHQYTTKTISSKNLTQKHRAHYSDPRTVSGFLPIWKEMTYQVITKRSEGSKLWDLDNNEYIDVIMGFGQYLFGHNPGFVREEIEKQLKLGFEIGPQSPIAGEVARLICEFTGFDRAAFCVTGSEAVLGAIRAARTVTGKDKIVFFAGDYHGIIDEVLIKTIINGDQVRTMPIAPGIPKENVQNTIALEYGTEESLRLIEKLLPEIGGIMVEPVQARRPDFQPKEFLQKLRKITEDAGIPLIFDEVITGFRTSQGGAQEWFGIKADIGTFGKVIGGGFPIGVIAGKKLYMDSFDGGYWQYGDDSIPEAGVTFFAGTFARHPLSLTACYAVLNYLKSRGGSLQKELNQKAKQLSEELNAFLTQRNVPIKIMNFSSVIYYSHPKDLGYFSLLFYVLRHKGIHILEGFPMFMSEAHNEKDIREIIIAFKESIIELQENGFFPPPILKENNNPLEETDLSIGAIKISPLSEAQKEMWIGSQMRPEAAGPHHACSGIYLHGSLNIDALKKAIRSVIKKHDALRSTISEDGSSAIINSEMKVNIAFDDLSGLREDAGEMEVNKILHKEAQRFLDLNTGPLVEFRILKLSAQKHILILTAQMIICDGWSHYVLFEDLSSFYSAFTNNVEPVTEPAVSMKIYADWEQNNRDSIEEKECEKFWLSRFESVPEPVDLPSTKLRPSTRTYNGDRRTVKINEKLYTNIKRIGVEQKSSSFAILFAAYYVWLSRLSDNNDIVVGVPFAAQSPLGMDRLIGQCANTLPLRVQLETDEPFSSVIKKTWSSVLDAQENWNFSFGRLVSKLNISPDSSRIPLVSILFNIDPPMDKVTFSGIKHKFITGPRHYFQYDLGFNLVEDEKSINVECDFNPDLFEGKIIEEWANGYIAILESIVENPDSPINTLPMLERTVEKDFPVITHDLTVNNSGSPIDYLDLFRKQVEDQPDKTAIESDSESLTYAELDINSDQLSSFLSSLEVGPGTIIGIYLKRNIHLPEAVLGVIKSGGIYLLLDPDMPLSQIRNQAGKIGTDFILTDDELYSNIDGKLNHLIRVDRVIKKGIKKTSSPLTRSKKSGGLHCIIPKSEDKIVELNSPALTNTLFSLQEELRFNNNDVFLYNSFYSTGYELIELLLPLMAGAKVYITQDVLISDIGSIETLVEKQKITALLFTPSVWNKLLKQGIKFNRGIKALTSGEYLRPVTAEKLSETFGEAWNLYGSIETGLFSLVNKIGSGSKNILGKTLCNIDVVIVDKNFSPVPAGIPGEIFISGKGLANRYYNNPELTNKRFINIPGKKLQTFFRTNDFGRYTSDGSIEFLSTTKRKVKIKNFHFETSDIEKILQDNSLIADALLIQNEIFYTAYIVLRDNRGSSDPKETIKNIRRYLRSRIPDYMIPEKIIILNEIPLDHNGKIDYEGLPLPDENAIEQEDYTAPGNKTEETLAGIWQELLKIERVSVKDSFFDLGGQSLLAVRLFNRIEEEFGKRFPLAMLFKAPTIEELAKRLTNESNEISSEWQSLIPIQPKGSGKPLYLVHGAGGNVLLYRTLSKYLEPDIPLYGLQSRGLDGISKPLKTVEEMAENYLEEIIRVQPEGPYFLGGYCLGGTIAYEMAQRLVKMGEEVGIVAMLDTYNFALVEKTSFTRFIFEKLRFHMKNFSRLKLSEMPSYLKEKKRLAGDGGWAHIRTEMPGTTLGDSFGRAESGIELSVQSLNDHAGDLYIPKPYGGRLTVFKPQKNYSFYSDPKMGWGDLVEDLEVIELPINPHAMLVEPYVEQLAEELKKHLPNSNK
ncbi:MAG TPA: amino acid adenylation domain-containing protein [Ignavibacteriaceae bacterium]|nr:amino acid adenylation domain-containing protein [Ignavibacteriaceae bacterium]